MSNRRFARVTAVVVTVAVAVTLVMMFYPEALGMSTGGTAMAYEDALFDAKEIMTVDIAIDAEEWQTLLDNALLEEYVACDITINGTTAYNAGIRCKGNSSLRQVGESQRYSFKVQFDEYVSGQTILGLDKMAFNNMQGDTTWMKEYLAYYTMDRIGVHVPLYAFANIYVNGEFWGVYLALEVLEESYAMRNFGTNYGHLYKVESMDMNNMGGGQNLERQGEGFQMMNFQPPAVEGGGVANLPEMGDIPDIPENAEEAPVEGSTQAAGAPNRQNRGLRNMEGGFAMFSGGNGADLIYVDDELESYSAIFTKTAFKKTTDSDKQRVVEALKAIDDPDTPIEDAVDVDEMLRYIAGNAAVGNSDSYFGNMMHNYYVYEKNGKITMLPWDYNLAYGGFGGNADTLINLSIDEPFTSGSLEDRPIMQRLLEDEKYKEIYYGYIREIGGMYTNGEVEALIDFLDELIRPWVELDPTREYTLEQYDAGVAMLKEYIALRGQSMLSQLEGDDTKLDTSAIALSAMGSQGGGMGGNRGGGGGGMMREFSEADMENMRQRMEEWQAQAGKTQADPGGAEAPVESARSSQGGMMPPGQGGQGGQIQAVDSETLWLLGISAGALLLALVFALAFRRRRWAS